MPCFEEICWAEFFWQAYGLAFTQIDGCLMHSARQGGAVHQLGTEALLTGLCEERKASSAETPASMANGSAQGFMISGVHPETTAESTERPSNSQMKVENKCQSSQQTGFIPNRSCSG